MKHIHNCKSCKFFVAHYYWFRTRLTFSRGGHCTKRSPRPFVCCDSVCENWEPDEHKQERQTEEIETALLKAAKQLNEVAALFKADS